MYDHLHCGFESSTQEVHSRSKWARDLDSHSFILGCFWQLLSEQFGERLGSRGTPFPTEPHGGCIACIGTHYEPFMNHMHTHMHKSREHDPENTESENMVHTAEGRKMISTQERKFRETDRINQAFVATVIIEVLKNCSAMGYCPDETLDPHMRHLAQLVIAGLPLNHVPRVPSVRLAQAVRVALKSKFGPYMNIHLNLQDPMKEAAIAECIQSKIIQFSEERPCSGFATFCLGAVAGAVIATAVTFSLGRLRL